MHPAQDNMPTPIGKLDDLLMEGDSSSKPYKVFIGHNLGYRTFTISLPMRELYEISEVANERGPNGEPVAQRKLDITHARKLGKYILKGLMSAAIQKRTILGKEVPEVFYELQKRLGNQPYLSMQPIVANIRTCSLQGANLAGTRMMSSDGETACFKVMLSQKDVLWIVDGQHRRYGMYLVFEFLDDLKKSQNYSKRNALFPAPHNEQLSAEELTFWQECYEVARQHCTVSAEVHLGLGPEEERQLFHDLNNLGKKVERSLALQFDSSNPINQFIKEVLIDDVLDWEIVEKDVPDWHKDTGAIARKDLVAVNAVLFLNKSNISGATPATVELRVPYANRFWEEISKIEHLGKERAKINTVAAQPVVLKALAKICFDLLFSKRKPENGEELFDQFITKLKDVDFSHNNPMWRYYTLSAQEITHHNLDTLRSYLPSSDDGANRDIGAFDAKQEVFRFGAKHNDIFPILADMVRWATGLPNRHKES